MKNKLYIVIILLTLSSVILAEDKKISESKTVEVSVETDGDKATKKVTVNGKELSAKEIEEFEASGQMKTLHINKGDKHANIHKVILMDDEDVADDENIDVFVETDGDKVTKKVIVNGKELSPQEIKDFEARGKMKVIHLDTNKLGKHGSKMVFIKSDNDSPDPDVNVEVIMDKLDVDASGHHVWKSHDGKQIKVIKKIINKNKNSASLGFVANVEDDGWHLNKVIENSGAYKAQIKVGDIVTKIAGVDLTKDKNKDLNTLQKLPKFEVGESVKVDLLRNGKVMTFDVIASRLDNNMFVGTDASENKFHWIEDSESKTDDLTKQVKVMVFKGEDGDFKLNTDDIHMVFPDDLGDMNFFVSDGKSTSNLLGKNHELSSLSHELGKYFSTKDGVLVLHVEDNNAFALKDGDVIKSIDGVNVNLPKDVIKQLLKADNQEDIKIKIVRHKRNKTLKYNK